MTHFKSVIAVLAGFLLCSTALSSCVDVDNTLGADIIPEEQKMRFATTTFNSFDDGVEYFTTRLFRSDSISTSNQSSLYIGAMQSDTFGMRTAGFFSQHTPYNSLDSAFFGYLPIIDSVMFMLSVSSYAGDTTYVQGYEVFEVSDNSFIDEAPDSVYLAMALNGEAPAFNIEDYIDESDPLFTFNFPDQANEVYTTSTRFRMEKTQSGLEYLRRLLFIDEDREYTIDYDYDGDGEIDTADIREVYTTFTEWVERFKGLYVRPTSTPTGSEQGALYASDITSSGIIIYGRSLEMEDVTIVKDTIGMTYAFYPVDEADEDDIADGIYHVGGELSINSISHDYTSSSVIDFNQDVATSNTLDVESIPTASTIYVEGFGGIATQIDLNRDIFLKLDSLLEEEYASTGDEFESIFFNQAVLKIYLLKESGVEVDPLDINPLVITSWLNSAPASLGLYSQYTAYVDSDGYTTLVGVSDYDYYYEAMGYDLDFGGDLNRSWGCYTFNIPGQLQLAWNSYVEAKEAAGDDIDSINWDDVEYCTMYLAPVATSLLSLQSVALQSMTWESVEQGTTISSNNVPMEMSVAYTMID